MAKEKKEIKKDEKKHNDMQEKQSQNAVNNKNELIKSLCELALIVVAIIVILVFFPNSVAWNIVVLLLILSCLIFVHEFGHFIMAKLFKVHVYEFALGMGPKILGFHRRNDPTEYTLRALPIGGFCGMAGEEGEDDDNLKKEDFMCNKPKWQRLLILVAGVTMNFITALVLLFAISLIWGSTEQTSIIGYVEPDSPAYLAGITEGDKIISLNGYKVNTWDKVTIVSSLKNKDKTYNYEILHKNGQKETIKLTPATYVVVDNKNIRVPDGVKAEEFMKEEQIDSKNAEIAELVGIGAPSETKKGFANAISYAFTKFGSLVSSLFLVIISLITGKLGLGALAGPVGMYSVVGEVAAQGLANIIFLMAYLSINLGVVNILPFPAFDGGRVVFVLIEAITRKKVDARIEGAFHTVGFILLMLLMLVITFQDILRLF